MRRGNLDDLAVFSRIVRLGGFSRAAAELETSTSNLSHAIKRLETRLGLRLLQRTSRSVAPTEAGARLLATFDPAIESIEGALHAAALDRGAITGTLRITATREGYEAVVRPALASFTGQHPGAIVEVSIAYGFQDLVAAGFDAGIRLGEKLEKDMVGIKLGPDLRMAVVAAPAYIAVHGRPAEPRDLVGHSCFNYRMMTTGALYPWEFEREGRAFEVRVSGPLAFNEPAPMLQAAMDGLGIAYVLEREAAGHVARGRLVRLLDEWTPPFPGFHLYHPSRRQMRPALVAFIAAARAEQRRIRGRAGPAGDAGAGREGTIA